MPVAPKTLDPAVMEILSRATWTDAGLVLPPIKDHKLYVKVDTALERIGGTWDRRAKAHTFEALAAAKAAIQELLDSGKIPSANPLNFWPTPDTLAAVMVNALGLPPSHERPSRVLEPSAGEGSLLRAVQRLCGAFHELTAVEIDTARARTLRESRLVDNMAVADFLMLWPTYFPDPFDYVLMNPPFSVEGNTTVYVDHIRHAFTFLKPGGRLVALAPTGFTFTDTKKLKGFLAWVDHHGGWTALDPAAFKAVGTATQTTLICLTKPADAA